MDPFRREMEEALEELQRGLMGAMVGGALRWVGGRVGLGGWVGGFGWVGGRVGLGGWSGRWV